MFGFGVSGSGFWVLAVGGRSHGLRFRGRSRTTQLTVVIITLMVIISCNDSYEVEMLKYV